MDKLLSRAILPVLGCGLIVLFSLSAHSSAQRSRRSDKCGVERWPVKTVSDPDAKHLFTASGQLKKARKKTISDLIFLAYPFPAPNSIPRTWYTRRVHPFEETIVELEAVLTAYKREKDKDYHLVIEDENGNTMIAEIIAPGCVKSSNPLLREKLQQARNAFDAKFPVTGNFRDTRTKVRITGIPFFDRPHDQKGAADNGIEIHPVLSVEFPD